MHDLTTKASGLVTQGYPSTSPQVVEKEAAYQGACGRLQWRKDALAKAEAERDKLYKRWELYDEIWTLLDDHRIEEDQQRRDDGRRQIWDIQYRVGGDDLPDGDEWSADGDTPPPTPPVPSVEEEEEAARQLTEASEV